MDYRVDLSVVVSKYVGETEENLSSLFEAARRRDWILFFDAISAMNSVPALRNAGTSTRRPNMEPAPVA